MLSVPSPVLRHQSGPQEAPTHDSQPNRETGTSLPGSRHGSRRKGGPLSKEYSHPWCFYSPQLHSHHGLQVSFFFLYNKKNGASISGIWDFCSKFDVGVFEFCIRKLLLHRHDINL